MFLECLDQRRVHVWDRPSGAAQVENTLVLVQHFYERLYILNHLVLNIHLLRAVTRKGESRLGDNPILDKSLDL
jgi:hypothetical protein